MATETYEIPCADGSDPGCYGTVEVELEAGLTDEEAAAAASEEGDDICAACGSDYTRNPDGSIAN